MQAQAKLHAEKAITDAQATGQEPQGCMRNPNAATQLSGPFWDAFVASAQCIDSSHLAMHDALFTTLVDLQALVQ